VIAATETPWWAALVGVAVGSAITAAMNVVGSWWRSRTAAVAAARVLTTEMEDALKLVKDTLEKPEGERKWPRGWEPWSDTWKAFREPVARRWRVKRFNAVAKAYARMQELSHGLETRGNQPFEDTDARFFCDWQRDLTKALAELGRPSLNPAFNAADGAPAKPRVRL
jgi:hypothetical protein